MEDVRRRIPHTIRRNGIYYFQRRVPADLVEAFGFVHFKQSLETSDPSEAERKLHAAKALYFEQIDTKRKTLTGGGAPLVRPAPLKLGALKSRLREYVNGEFVTRRQTFHKRSRQRPLDLIDQARAEAEQQYEALCDPVGEFTVERMNAVATALFPENEFGQPLKGPIHNLWHPINGPFRHYLRWSLLEIERRTIRYLNGDPSGIGATPDFLLQVPANAASEPTAGDGGKRSATLAEVCAMRLATHEKGSAREQRKAQIEAAQNLMLRFFGRETIVRLITPKMCEEFQNIVASLPNNHTKRFSAEMPIREIVDGAAKAKIATISASTQETYLAELRNTMQYAVDRWLADRNPADGIKSLATPPRRARVDYDEELLKRIFQEPFMKGWDRMRFDAVLGQGISDATRYWVPRIALFTGMRQSEICQLDVDDIRSTKAGVAYFLVQDDTEDKKIKRPGRHKAVPMHKLLLGAGLLAYVTAVRQAGHRKLFPGLVASSFGHYGAQVSKWITRQFRAAKYPKGVDFHAFRHTFAQALRQVDASSEVAARLGGWSTKTGVMERYGGALHDKWIEHMNTVLQKISYGDAEAFVFEAGAQ